MCFLIAIILLCTSVSIMCLYCSPTQNLPYIILTLYLKFPTPIKVHCNRRDLNFLNGLYMYITGC